VARIGAYAVRRRERIASERVERIDQSEGSVSGAEGWVAVIDDDPAFTELALEILASEGIAGRVLRGADATLATLRRDRPSVLVLDWRLAEASAETAETLITQIVADEDLRHLPIVLCSGDMVAVRQATPRLVALADVVAIEKPFEIDTFIGTVERALHRAGHTLGGSAPGPPPPSPDVAGHLATADLGSQARRFLAGARDLGWQAADLWLLDGGLLRCVAVDSDRPRAAFARASLAMPMLSGVGIVGRVAISGRPVWIEDVAVDRNFPRVELAGRAGIRSAAGVPMLLDHPPGATAMPHVVAGVLGVYATERRERDDPALAALWSFAQGGAAWAALHHDALLAPPPGMDRIGALAEQGLADADLVVVDAVGADGDLYRLATAHRDPQRQQLARLLATYQAVGTGPAGDAARSGAIQRASPSDAQLRRWGRSPEHLTLLRALELRDIVSIPIGDAAGRVVGVLSATSALPGTFNNAGLIARLRAIAGELGALLGRDPDA
jgi:DNA-binding response OmpR family regulator